MSTSKIMEELAQLGSEQTRKTFRNHGAPESMFGVKVGDLKPIAKRLKGQQATALELYDSGNSDAMYLAGMIADGAQMTAKQLDAWARDASWHMISEYTVPGVAAMHPKATSIATKWMKSKQAHIASCGWATYSLWVGVTPDDDLDLDEIRSLLDSVKRSIDDAPNRVRYCMNGFVISVGSYVTPLLKEAQDVARHIGPVQVDVGNTACKVPLATEYIDKIVNMGRVGQKRKSTKC